jgi:squalene cyclase
MLFKVSAVVLACVVLLCSFAAAQEAEEAEENAGVDRAAIQKAVERGLAFLHSAQNADGSWGSGSHSRHVGITGLAAMAMMSQGNLPGRGKYGEDVRKAISFILKNTNPHSGFISHDNSTRMYGHGFATLALAEAYGMDRNEGIHEKLKKAIRLIIRSQKSDGGWRYDPSPQGMSDLSVTVCQVMALRAARNAGIKVPKDVIDRAIEYVKKSANPNGSFRYMLGSGTGSSHALAAAGLTTLFGAGQYDLPEIKAAVQYLKRSKPQDFSHFFYGHYYAAQAMYQAGEENWKAWHAKIARHLLEKQQKQADGSWSGEINNEYCTAMACIILQVDNCYLPIFQR